jgi:hypothetical protein
MHGCLPRLFGAVRCQFWLTHVSSICVCQSTAKKVRRFIDGAGRAPTMLWYATAHRYTLIDG